MGEIRNARKCDDVEMWNYISMIGTAPSYRVGLNNLNHMALAVHLHELTLFLYLCRVSRLTTIFIIVILSVSSLNAQERVDDERLGAWTIFNLQYAFSPKWGVWGELQSRLQSPFFDLFYYEQKGGAWYNIDKNFQVLMGTGHYATHDFENFSEGPVIREARLWQQLTINQYLSRVKFEHRYRIEQRWLNREFQDRFRYRLNVAIPLNKEKFQPKTVFLSGFNEIFLTSRKPHFMRNRVFIGVGYQIDTHISILVGWLNQYNYNFNNAGAKNNISINLTIRLQDKDDSPTRIPTPMD